MNMRLRFNVFGKEWVFLLSALFVIVSAPAYGDGERIVFLHHSTGGAVYSEGGVADWFQTYNQNNGTTFQITERGYPTSPYPWDNYPYDYWNLWVNGACDSNDRDIECLNTLTQNYEVVIFKHCYPGAAILEDSGSPSVSSPEKRLENYRLQYRALRTVMDGYPNTIFIVWTLAPLHRLATDSEEAARAKQFVDWVNHDFLAEEGTHPNIFIFDFWGIVAEDDPTPAHGQVNCLRYEYESSHDSGDSHPNQSANEVAGPAFAQRIVDAIQIFTEGGGATSSSSSGSSSSGSSSGGSSSGGGTGGSPSGGAADSGGEGSGSGCFIEALSAR
jgi:hypothetical protein